ncbi:MAG: SH3 domain-containing protein [Anaerolinea sp.]
MRAIRGGIFALLATLWIVPTIAQQSCPVLVRQALQSLGTNCAQLGRNVVCYGNDQVRARFTEEVAEDFFTKPADIASLSSIASVTATSLSLDENIWGVAVMNVQANVPETLPGQAVTFILLGDVEVENAVDPAEAAEPRPSIPVTTRVNGNIRSGPGTNFNRLGVAPAGSVLNADALSADRQWVRIVYRDTVGWMFRDNLGLDPAIDSLRPADLRERGLMQAFFLRSGIGEPACTEAPSQALLVQGPKNYTVNLTVNGAQVNISSSVMFRTLGEEGDQLEISVLDGQAEVLPDIPGGQPTIIREGFRSVFCLGNPDNRGADGEANDKVVTCNGTRPERIPPSDVARYCQLRAVASSEVLNYPVGLFCPGDRPVQPPPQRPTPQPGQPTPPPQTGGACSVVSVIGPYDRVNGSAQFIQWNPAPGADSYEVRVFNTNGAQIASINTGGVTGTTISPLQLTSDPFIYYEVIAFAGGQFLCSSGRIGGLQVVGNFTASVTCSAMRYNVSWDGALPSDVITLEVVGYGTHTIGSGSSGSAMEPAPTCVADVIIRSSSGGQRSFSGVDCSC